MKPVIMAGVIGVNLALICYLVGVITEQLRHKVTLAVLWLLTIGSILDIAATICMLVGTEQSAFTIHGIIGYSALAGMAVATILAWLQRQKTPDAPLRRGLHLYFRYAFIWWLITWGSGVVMAMSRRSTGAI